MVVYEAQVWNVLTDKEKKLVMSISAEFDFDLVRIIKSLEQRVNEKSKPLIRPSRMDTIRKKAVPFKAIWKMNSESESFANWYYEKKLLGYTHNKSLRDIFVNRFVDLQTIREIHAMRENTKVSFVASVDKNSQTRTSRAGNKYLMFDCSDETGTINFKLFAKQLPAALALNGEKTPKEDNIVILQGTKKEGNCVFGELYVIQSNKIYTKLSDIKSEQLDKEAKTE